MWVADSQIPPMYLCSHCTTIPWHCVAKLSIGVHMLWLTHNNSFVHYAFYVMLLAFRTILHPRRE